MHLAAQVLLVVHFYWSMYVCIATRQQTFGQLNLVFLVLLQWPLHWWRQLLLSLGWQCSKPSTSLIHRLKENEHKHTCPLVWLHGHVHVPSSVRGVISLHIRLSIHTRSRGPSAIQLPGITVYTAVVPIEVLGNLTQRLSEHCCLSVDTSRTEFLIRSPASHTEEERSIYQYHAECTQNTNSQYTNVKSYGQSWLYSNTIANIAFEWNLCCNHLVFLATSNI